MAVGCRELGLVARLYSGWWLQAAVCLFCLKVAGWWLLSARVEMFVDWWTAELV